MKRNEQDDLVLEYVGEDLSPEREQQLEALLAEQGLDIGELREMRRLYADLGRVPVPEPRSGMTDRFYRMLEAEKERVAAQDRSHSALLSRLAGGGRLWPRLAYAALFILLGWSAAYWVPPGGHYERKLRYMATEVTEMRKMMMFSMLNQSSATERLRAVQYLRGLVSGDEQVLTAMLDLFERDPNVNVRLAVLDALADSSGDQRVRASLVQGIEGEESPIIQLALVEFMVSMREKRAVEPLRRLLGRDDLNMLVRGRIEEGLRLLS
jgi:hypothetical protein